MITIQSLRAAVFASDPYTELHDLVRNEMRAGLKVKEVFDSINPLRNRSISGDSVMTGAVDIGASVRADRGNSAAG